MKSSMLQGIADAKKENKTTNNVDREIKDLAGKILDDDARLRDIYSLADLIINHNNSLNL